MFEDKSLVCQDCGQEFIFTVGEQEFYAEKGFENEPKRCRSAVLTAAATAALVTVLLVKCTQLFVQNVELTLRFHSVLLMAGQFTARNVSKDNGPLSKVIRSTYTGLVSPVFYFLRGCKRGRFFLSFHDNYFDADLR